MQLPYGADDQRKQIRVSYVLGRECVTFEEPKDQHVIDRHVVDNLRPNTRLKSARTVGSFDVSVDA